MCCNNSSSYGLTLVSLRFLGFSSFKKNVPRYPLLARRNFDISPTPSAGILATSNSLLLYFQHGGDMLGSGVMGIERKVKNERDREHAQ